MRAQVVCPIEDSSAVGAARREALEMASRLALPETEKGRIAIVAVELANNIVRHGGHGSVFLQPIPGSETGGVELLASDAGPGMADIEQCLRDGYSTAGTPGTGLGAVRRLSSEFDVYTRPNGGTIVLSRIVAGGRASGGIQCGAVYTCAPGEDSCGDGWSLARKDDQVALLVADGLGHGAGAAEASDRAVAVFEARAFAPVRTIFDEAHGALRHTRGAAVAVARFAVASGPLSFTAVGNIAGALVSADGRARGLVSHGGTVGAGMPIVREFSYEWPPGDTLVVHSDGIRSRWSLADHPGLLPRHPAVIAASLVRDHSRGPDDAAVLVIRRAA